MSLSIFNSSHNHNNAIFNMIHIVCPIAKIPNDIHYEIQGNMGTSIESNIKFIENLRTPHIISFFGKKGETYFIRVKYKDIPTGKENKIINFYRQPDDYNDMPIDEDTKVNIEITKKKQKQEKNVQEEDDEVLKNNMVLNFIKNKEREATDESKDELYGEEEEEEDEEEEEEDEDEEDEEKIEHL